MLFGSVNSAFNLTETRKKGGVLWGSVFTTDTIAALLSAVVTTWKTQKQVEKSA